jgi:TetR/AcrR family transcriptional regulator, cholesterol catabolism regulator
MASQTRRTSTTRVQERVLSQSSSLPGRRAPASGERVPAHPKAIASGQGKHTEIFNAALRLFQAKGYHGASMQDIADAVGMQKASLYYYFHSKEELLVLVCERGSGAFTQELEEIVASDLNATEKLERAIECHLVALCEQLDLFTVFLREQKFLGAVQKRQLRGEGKKHAELLAMILEQGISSGEFRTVNVTVTALAVLGMCNWLYEWYSPDGALSPREIAADFSQLTLNGLAHSISQDSKASKKKSVSGHQ